MVGVRRDLQQEALDVLNRRVSELLASDEYSEIREKLAPGLIEQVVDLAWQHQFRRHGNQFKREIQHVINSAVDGGQS